MRSIMESSMLMLLVFCFSPATAASGNSSVSLEDCATVLNVLEHALYETGDNIFEMNRNFYPPEVRASRFTEVSYTFLNEEGEDDGCNVTYFWAIGVLLFFQPPSLFKFNSLYFNYPNNNLTTVYLQLPYQCRPLVNVSSNGKCSCNADSSKLNILTQQLNIYGKYSDLVNVEREDTFARAICSDHLYHTFYSGQVKFTFAIVFLTIILPVVFFIVLVILIRNVSDNTISAFSDPSKHATVVSTVLVSVVISFGILIFDLLACSVVIMDNHEYHNELGGLHPLNLNIVYGTLVCDIFFLLPTLFSSLYIASINVWNIFKKDHITNPCKGRYIKSNSNTPLRLKYCDFFCCWNMVVDSLAWIIGTKTLHKIRKISHDQIIPVMFLSMLFSSLMCFSSHIGYILLAWLTEPSKCTTILILFYLIIAFLYLSFRRSYKNYGKVRIEWKTRCTTAERCCMKEEDIEEINKDELSQINNGDAADINNTDNVSVEYCISCLGPSVKVKIASKDNASKDDASKDDDYTPKSAKKRTFSHQCCPNASITKIKGKDKKNIDVKECRLVCCKSILCSTLYKNRQMESEKYSHSYGIFSNCTCCCFGVKKLKEDESESVNIQACCLVFFFGIFFLGIAAMMIAVLIVLPLSSEELASYLFNIFQLSIVIITTQIAYELYFGSSFNLKHILNKFRKAFVKRHEQNKAQNEDNKDDNKDDKLVKIARDHNYEIIDAAGEFGAELFEVVVHKYYKDEAQKIQNQEQN